MPPVNRAQVSFAAGAIPDSAQGRFDESWHAEAVAEAVNFEVTPNGSLKKRPGAQYVWSDAGGTLTSVKWLSYLLPEGKTLALLMTPDIIYGFVDGAQTVQWDGSPAGDGLGRVDIAGWGEHTARNPQTNIRAVQIGDSLYLVRPTRRLARLKIEVIDVDDDSDPEDGHLKMTWTLVDFVEGFEPRITAGLNAFAPIRRCFIDAGNSLYEFDLNAEDTQGGLRKTQAQSDPTSALTVSGGQLLTLLWHNDRTMDGVEINPDGADPQNNQVVRLELSQPDGTAADKYVFGTADFWFVIDRALGRVWQGATGAGARQLALGRLLNVGGSGAIQTQPLLRSGATCLFIRDKKLIQASLTATSNTEGRVLRNIPANLSAISGLKDDYEVRAMFLYNGRLILVMHDADPVPENREAFSHLIEIDPEGFSEEYEYVRKLNFACPARAGAAVLQQSGQTDRVGSLQLDDHGFASIAYYQGRLALAGHPFIPNALFLSDVNEFNKFTAGTEDDDALFLQLTNGPISGIHWMDVWQNLLVMTSVWGVYQLRPVEFGGAVTPSAFDVRFTSTVGSSPHVPGVRTEEGVIFPNEEEEGIFFYNYKESADIFSSRVVSNRVRDLIGRRVTGLEYGHGASARLFADTVGRAPRGEDLRDLTHILYAEGDENLAGTRWLLPDHWTGHGGILCATDGLWVTMIGAGGHDFVVGFIEFDSDRELDFSVLHGAGAPFTQISAGHDYLGAGTAVTVRDRVRRTEFTRTVTAGGGLDRPFPSTQLVEVGLPVPAHMRTLRRRAAVDQIGQPARVSRARVLARKTNPAWAPEGAILNAALNLRTPVTVGSDYPEPETGGHWWDLALEGEQSTDPEMRIETVENSGVEILAVAWRMEVGDN